MALIEISKSHGSKAQQTAVKALKTDSFQENKALG